MTGRDKINQMSNEKFMDLLIKTNDQLTPCPIIVLSKKIK